MDNINFKFNKKNYVIAFRAGGDGGSHYSGWGKATPFVHTSFLIHIYCTDSPAFRINGIWSKGCCVESVWDDVNIASTEFEDELLNEAERALTNEFKKYP